MIHPERGMNVCAKFHGGLLKTCLDISLKTTNVNVTVGLRGESEDQKSLVMYSCIVHYSCWYTSVWLADWLTGGQANVAILRRNTYDLEDVRIHGVTSDYAWKNCWVLLCSTEDLPVQLHCHWEMLMTWRQRKTFNYKDNRCSKVASLPFLCAI